MGDAIGCLKEVVNGVEDNEAREEVEQQGSAKGQCDMGGAEVADNGFKGGF